MIALARFLLLCAVWLVLPAITAQAQSTVAINPPQGPAGVQVIGSGTNWKSGDRIQVSWASTGSILANATVQSNGTFNTSFNVPSNTVEGRYTIYFTDLDSRYFLDKIFTVTTTTTQCPIPRVHLSKTSGPIGTTTTITGNGWVPGGTVNISVPYGSKALFSVTSLTPKASSSGDWHVDITALQGTPPGEHIINFEQKTTYCSLSVHPTFTVTLPDGTTAGVACMFNAPKTNFVLGLVGHAGWAFRDGTENKWVFGATENLHGDAYISPGKPADSQSWQSKGTWNQVLRAFRTGLTGQTFTPGSGYYKSYRCVDVNISYPAKAKNEANAGQKSGYNVINNNCLTKAVDIFRLYGVTHLRLAQGKMPNIYYIKPLTVAGFKNPPQSIK